jgi:hypothetical protein
MTMARRIDPRGTPDVACLGRAQGCRSLDTLLASIVATQAGAIERFEAGAAMIAGMLESYHMKPEDRAALVALLRAHRDEIAAERARLANLRGITFVFPEDDGLLVVPTAA